MLHVHALSLSPANTTKRNETGYKYWRSPIGLELRVHLIHGVKFHSVHCRQSSGRPHDVVHTRSRSSCGCRVGDCISTLEIGARFRAGCCCCCCCFCSVTGIGSNGRRRTILLLTLLVWHGSWQHCSSFFISALRKRYCTQLFNAARKRALLLLGIQRSAIISLSLSYCVYCLTQAATFNCVNLLLNFDPELRCVIFVHWTAADDTWTPETLKQTKMRKNTHRISD